MAKFVVSYTNPDNKNEEHEIVEAPSKEEAVKVLRQKKFKNVEIDVTNNNLYKGTKPAFNEGKR